MDSEDFSVTEDILNNVNEATFDLLPHRSKERYLNEKDKFLKWMKSKEVSVVTEEVVVDYFKVLMEKYAPSSLWATYSMLRSTLFIFEKVDISKFKTLFTILKDKSKGYQPKKAKTFELKHLEKFLNEAPDEIFLLMKVVVVMGVMGACRCEELVNLKTTDIHDKGNIVIVNFPKTKTFKPRSFALCDGEGKGFNGLEIYRKYAALRPTSLGQGRFFIGFRSGKCTVQPVGINMISKVPKLVAKYLNLKDAHLYTGHSFRRTSAVLLDDSSAHILTLKQHGGWCSTSIAESFEEHFVAEKMKRMIASSEESAANKKVCVDSEKLENSMEGILSDHFLTGMLNGELTKIENDIDDSESKIEINDTFVTPEFVELKTTKNEISIEESDSNCLLGNPLRLSDKPNDEFQVFGDFVASELRNLRSRENQNKLKRMIQRAILEISEADDDTDF